jgi:hydroxymethylglutaryl-CoA lyase
MSKPEISIVEVGLRDGLQMAKGILPTELKKRWIREAAAAGVRTLEVCSFVPAKVVPGMADAAEVTRFARTSPGITVIALAPNARGAASAFAAGAHRVTMPISVSASHLMANVRKTHDQAIDELKAAVALRDAIPAAVRPKLDVGLSTAFGCSMEGAVPTADVIRLTERCLAAGADSVGLADTVGVANPAQVRRLYAEVWNAVGHTQIGPAHFHNTRGQGLANALAALDIGVTGFDTALAGLGGCPFAPGASGNVCTEDLVWMIEEMGFSTGIDLAKLIACREILSLGLPDDPLQGHVATVGLAKIGGTGRIASAR